MSGIFEIDGHCEMGEKLHNSSMLGVVVILQCDVDSNIKYWLTMYMNSDVRSDGSIHTDLSLVLARNLGVCLSKIDASLFRVHPSIYDTLVRYLSLLYSNLTKQFS
jgi:hypothetical protein